jgi:hypothetical protein
LLEVHPSLVVPSLFLADDAQLVVCGSFTLAIPQFSVDVKGLLQKHPCLFGPALILSNDPHEVQSGCFVITTSLLPSRVEKTLKRTVRFDCIAAFDLAYYHPQGFRFRFHRRSSGMP